MMVWKRHLKAVMEDGSNFFLGNKTWAVTERIIIMFVDLYFPLQARVT